MKFITDYSYSGLVTKLALQGALTAQRTYDSRGKLVSTVDTAGHVTHFRYDGQGNPILIQDSANQTTARYNNLGQKLEVNDPDRGRWTFVYDGIGELLSQTDANGNTTTFLYDRLGRMYGRKVNGTVDGYWLYDGQKKGLVDSEQDRPGSPTFLRQYTYDNLSRPTKTTTTVDGIAFTVEQAYDSYYGRVKGVGYPSGEVLELNYDDFGYLVGERDAADAEGSVFRQVQAMTARGQVTQERFGNNLTGFYAYHGSTGQMASTCVSMSTSCTSPVQRIDYGYEDPYENLTVQRDVVQGVTERYTYDNLQRLGSATRTWSSGLPAPARVNYGYDALGNITLKSDYAVSYLYGTMTRTFPDYAGPHAVQWAQKTSGAWTAFRYDGNGNMVQGDGRSVGYDAHNKPISITSPTGETSVFSYGPDGERYKQVTGSKTTYYVGKLHERIVTISGDIEQKDYVGGYLVITNRRSGIYNTRELRYLHKDRLGSVDAVTDAEGTVVERHGFDAFGKPRGAKWQDNGGLLSGGATTRGFTEHEHLDSQQLIHMNGRAYDYNLGRFLSVDPIIQSPANSQSLNPYSYILNNPLSGVDPTGYSCEDQTPGGNCANPNRVDLPGRAPTGSHIIRPEKVEAIYDSVTDKTYVGVTNGYTGQTTVTEFAGNIADAGGPKQVAQSSAASSPGPRTDASGGVLKLDSTRGSGQDAANLSAATGWLARNYPELMPASERTVAIGEPGSGASGSTSLVSGTITVESGLSLSDAVATVGHELFHSRDSAAGRMLQWVNERMRGDAEHQIIREMEEAIRMHFGMEQRLGRSVSRTEVLLGTPTGRMIQFGPTGVPVLLYNPARAALNLPLIEAFPAWSTVASSFSK